MKAGAAGPDGPGATRSIRRAVVLAGTTLGFCLTALAGCASGSGGAGTGMGQVAVDAPADTLRGTVLVVGADPVTQVVLRTEHGRVTLQGPALDQLRRVNGIGVRVDGRLEGTTMTAAGFRVREVDGVPAADGTLEIDGATAILTTPDGRRLRYAPVPTSLRARAGQHVWIAGRPGGEPQAWGVIGM